MLKDGGEEGVPSSRIGAPRVGVFACDGDGDEGADGAAGVGSRAGAGVRAGAGLMARAGVGASGVLSLENDRAREGDSTWLSRLEGRANGLEGRSEAGPS